MIAVSTSTVLLAAHVSPLRNPRPGWTEVDAVLTATGPASGFLVEFGASAGSWPTLPEPPRAGLRVWEGVLRLDLLCGQPRFEWQGEWREPTLPECAALVAGRSPWPSDPPGRSLRMHAEGA